MKKYLFLFIIFILCACKGKDGEQGKIGLTGLQGLTGKEGNIGLTGKEGKIGLTGKEGKIGLTGKEQVIVKKPVEMKITLLNKHGWDGVTIPYGKSPNNNEYLISDRPKFKIENIPADTLKIFIYFHMDNNPAYSGLGFSIPVIKGTTTIEDTSLGYKNSSWYYNLHRYKPHNEICDKYKTIEAVKHKSYMKEGYWFSNADHSYVHLLNPEKATFFAVNTVEHGVNNSFDKIHHYYAMKRSYHGKDLILSVDKKDYVGKGTVTLGLYQYDKDGKPCPQ